MSPKREPPMTDDQLHEKLREWHEKLSEAQAEIDRKRAAATRRAIIDLSENKETLEDILAHHAAALISSEQAASAIRAMFMRVVPSTKRLVAPPIPVASPTPAPVALQERQRPLLDEFAAATALGLSVHYLRHDRKNKRLIPVIRIGKFARYDIESVRAALLRYEQGGPK